MPTSPTEPILTMVRAQSEGRAVGLWSACTASPFALTASALQAVADRSCALVESTCNQVNQYGGYTGMKPAEFAAFARRIALGAGLAAERLVLGGDHLGPGPWADEPAPKAMARGAELVRGYVAAGYRKIHLDASAPCADDADRTGEAWIRVAAERTADLAVAAEAALGQSGVPTDPPVYVIGTEVPPPGGAREGVADVRTTPIDEAELTLDLTRQAFASRGLEAAWERVVALVVQPGVEFGDADVAVYDGRAAAELARAICRHDGLVYEAHSTDYQPEQALRELVADRFAILKVGPALTFAFREAVFALEHMERELLGGRAGTTLSNVRGVLEQAMRSDPRHWQKHYTGTDREVAYALKFSYLDRCRYYWAVPEVQAALDRLVSNLERVRLPATLLSQYMPAQAEAVRQGQLAPTPHDLIHHRIMYFTGLYSRACGAGT